MATAFDFQIVAKTNVSGVSLVVAQNEDAFSYITEEAELGYLPNGTVPLATEDVCRFISDAEHAHFSAALV